MAKTKYGKHIVRHPVVEGEFGQELRFYGKTDYQSNFSLTILRVTRPVLMEATPHTHDFDMYLYFLSLDPDNMGDLGAEIELGLGSEREKHIITAPASVYIPRGMLHGPLNFKRVDRPVLLVHPFLAAEYSKVPVP